MTFETQQPTAVWFYVQDGRKIGPVSSAEIKDLLRLGTIDADTHVWRNGLTEWTLIRKTELARELPEMPPAVAPELIGNGIAWWIAFLPLIFGLGDAMLIQIRVADSLSTGNVLPLFSSSNHGLPTVFCLAVTTLLMAVDLNRLYRAGYKPARLLFGFLLTPIYLFMRAHMLKQTPYYGFAWIACAVLVVLAS